MRELLSHFCLRGTPLSCERYGEGHINRTYLVTTDRQRYILQRLSRAAFADIPGLMENVEAVTSYLAARNADPRASLHLVPTREGGSWYRDEEGEFWRVYDFIEDSLCLQAPETPEDFYQRCVEFAVPFTKAYLTYISGVPDNMTHLQELKPYLMKGQDLEQRMNDALDGLSWAHTSSIHVDSVNVNSVLVLVDGYSVVDITAVADTYYYGKGELSDTSNIKLMVYDDGEKLWAESLELY